MFKPVSAKINFFKIDEKILKFWKKNKVFEKSVKQRPTGQIYSFYDGPPFITGLPHYGSLLSSVAKDVIPRYQTMKGKRVRRVWGWDCHGLPAETAVEQLLGLKNKRDIEKLGIEKFVNECRTFVSKTSTEWEWYINHVGRWVDFKNSYKTMDRNYMETVLWVFKQLYDQGLIYKGKRVSLFCPRCGTPLSKFEITMDEGCYRDTKDPAITIKFKVKDQNKYLLAWTTTPWTLPANYALAVDAQQDYVEIEADNTVYILAKKRAKEVFDQPMTILKTYKGRELANIKYEPLYTFFPATDRDYRVYEADFVSMEEGTGIVHIAPGFGEDDTILGEKIGLSQADSVDDEGRLVTKVKPWAGVFIKDADPKVIEDLKKSNKLFKEETLVHSYPYCYRCDSPLIYKSQVAWYVDIDQLRDQMLKTNQKIYWFPEHFKEGRFKYNIQVAPHWCISRTRYWGTPLPVWECECGERYVFGSIDEIEKASGQKVKELHRPDIDQITIKCQKCGSRAKRVLEVLDCWMESGSMPYAEWHYPFENQTQFQRGFPSDFIAEYTGQLRAWFYYLHVLSNALMKSHCFENVIVTGVILGNDGKKMSKSRNNYPDPKTIIEKYGGDALRLYLMGGQVMAGEDILVSEEEIAKPVRQLLLPLWNSHKFFVTFANLHQWTPKTARRKKPTQILNLWILSRLESVTQEVTNFLDQYNIPAAVDCLANLVADLSNWYIRRSRDRFRDGDKEAFETLYQILTRFCLLIAPLAPFLAEEIYKNLTESESIHLENWPVANKKLIDKNLEEKIKQARKIVEQVHAKRKEVGIKVRQPLNSLVIVSRMNLSDDIAGLILDETNVKNLEIKLDESIKTNDPLLIKLDIKLTPELRAEGEARELIRQIQELRKKEGCLLDEKIKVVSPQIPQNPQLLAYVKQKTLAIKIIPGEKLRIQRK